MFSRKIGFVGLSVTALALAVYVMSANAQQAGTAKTGQPGAGQQLTITGRIVDLHGYMTGQFPSADHAKCTADSIRQGVPAGIETSAGLIILGQGPASAAKKIMPFAFQDVEVTGKLYTKGNVKYLDLVSIDAAETEADDEGSDLSEE